MKSTTSDVGSRGLWIAFFGPDGAGKSAVIEQLKRRLAPTFSGISEFHFRPMFRRHRCDRPPETNPHGRAPRSTVISVLKLVYWLLDCWIGYLLTLRPGRRDERLMIFDRYLPDILVDPMRYRLPQSSLGWARRLASLAPRPDLCILLDVRADVVQQRKCEVSPAESQRQRTAYLSLFATMSNTLMVDAESSIDEVAQQVTNAILIFRLTSPFEPREMSLLVNG